LTDPSDNETDQNPPINAHLCSASGANLYNPADEGTKVFALWNNSGQWQREIVFGSNGTSPVWKLRVGFGQGPASWIL